MPPQTVKQESLRMQLAAPPSAHQKNTQVPWESPWDISTPRTKLWAENTSEENFLRQDEIIAFSLAQIDLFIY